MKDWLEEFLTVLKYSNRTYWAFILGLVSFILIGFLGDYMVDNFELSEATKTLESPIREFFIKRYDKVAIVSLVGFWVLAFKFYKKDKKKLFS